MIYPKYPKQKPLQQKKTTMNYQIQFANVNKELIINPFNNLYKDVNLKSIGALINIQLK